MEECEGEREEANHAKDLMNSGGSARRIGRKERRHGEEKGVEERRRLEDRKRYREEGDVRTRSAVRGLRAASRR